MTKTVKDFALQAAMDFTLLCDLICDSGNRMSSSSLAAFDQLVANITELGYFSPIVLKCACELQRSLLKEVDDCGGTPVPARSDEGDLIWLGGSEASRELAKLERSLDRYIAHSRYVSCALSAEAAVDRRRAELAKS